MQKDSRIKLIQNNTNKGLGATRNVGIKAANGEYISFLDSDDLIDKNYCLKLFTLAKKSNSDVAVSRLVHISANKSRILCKTSNKKVYSSFINKLYNSTTSACNKIYKKQFILDNALFFPEGIFYEDNLYSLRICHKANLITTCNAVCYYYIGRDDSITTSINLKKFFDLIRSRKSMLYYAHHNNFSQQEIDAIYSHIEGYIGINDVMYILKNMDLSKKDYARILKNIFSQEEIFDLKSFISEEYLCELDNTDSIKVSIIIPIYNAEQYLEQCLDAVVKQTLRNIEIICINDCSPDNSKEIVEKYIEEDKRIVFIDNKKNLGKTISFNNALKIAKGEFVALNDCDDFMELDMLEKLYYKAYKGDYNMVKSSFNFLKDDLRISGIENKSNINNEDFFNINLNQNCLLSAPANWCAIYKKSFIERHNLSYITDHVEGCYYGEDFLFFIEFILLSQHNYFIEEPLYNHRIGHISATALYKKKCAIFPALYKVHNLLKVKYRDKNYKSIIKKLYKGHLNYNYYDSKKFFDLSSKFLAQTNLFSQKEIDVFFIKKTFYTEVIKKRKLLYLFLPIFLLKISKCYVLKDTKDLFENEKCVKSSIRNYKIKAFVLNNFPAIRLIVSKQNQRNIKMKTKAILMYLINFVLMLLPMFIAKIILILLYKFPSNYAHRLCNYIKRFIEL